jgi:hypothetical protein
VSGLEALVGERELELRLRLRAVDVSCNLDTGLTSDEENQSRFSASVS